MRSHTVLPTPPANDNVTPMWKLIPMDESEAGYRSFADIYEERYSMDVKITLGMLIAIAAFVIAIMVSRLS